MTSIAPWVRSTLITFIAFFGMTISATDFAWTRASLVAAAVAAARTALSALVPGGSFGVKPDATPPLTEPDREYPNDGGEGV